MTGFDPISATLGGALIGVAASLLLLANGRIAGVSGILGAALTESGGRMWRVAFLIGLPLGTLLHALARDTEIVIAASPLVLVLAGLLVGVGTQIGGGCTSGHGVCGLARFSRRSLVATILFMTSAALVVFVRRVVAGG